ncbi:hypothetical protein [uncultured Methanolobus sp.]|uniref:tetratricopeptide repeat protein n=1 Tax=uncultured Methanolobus sp. TaxID=218300 RepID=UPI0029C672E5|nr:hypothetical protein [uncultured Methanolobus sp.]
MTKIPAAKSRVNESISRFKEYIDSRSESEIKVLTFFSLLFIISLFALAPAILDVGIDYLGDSDGDGYTNRNDAFPTDERYHLDTDGDGYADKIDAFPTDERYHLDSDNDGYADKIDPLPKINEYHVGIDKINDADELYQVAKLLHGNEDYEEAEKYVDKSLSTKYQNKTQSLKNAIDLALKDYSGLYAGAEKLLEINKNDSLALCSKGVALAGLHNYDEAIHCINLAIEYESNVSDIDIYKSVLEDVEKHQSEYNTQKSTKSSPQFYNLRFEDLYAGGYVVYVYADTYGASESLANTLAARCASGQVTSSKYDAVVVYLTDINTGIEYYGEYKITDYYS